MCLGYVPISSSAPRSLRAAFIPILLSEVEQEQRPSGNGDREAIVVGAGLRDVEGERAYTGFAPHIIRNVSANVFSLRRFGIFFLPKRNVFCRNVRNSTQLGYSDNNCRGEGVAVNRSNFSGQKDRGRTF